MPEREILDVRGADILTGVDSDGWELYNLELVTGDGNVELDAGYTYIYPSKRKLADQINDFVSSDTEHTIDIYDPGYLTLRNALYVFGPQIAFVFFYALLGGLSNGWKRIKLGKHQP